MLNFQILSPSTITAESLRPDLLLTTSDNWFYVLEQSFGFESNSENNKSRKKKEKYKELKFCKVSLRKVNSQTCKPLWDSGVFASQSFALQTMLTELGFDDKDQKDNKQHILYLEHEWCSPNWF